MGSKTTLKPIPSSEYDDHYYREFNRGFTEFSDQGHTHPLFAYVKEIIKERCNSGSILDVGCGRGELLSLALEGDFTVLGFDYFAAALMYAEEVVQRVNSIRPNSVGIFQCDAKELDLGEQRFDCVVALDIVEHLTDDELTEVYKRIHRSMHKDCIFILHTSPNRNIMVPIRAIAWLLRTQIKSSKFHINEQNVSSLRRGLDSHFSILKLWFVHDSDYYFNATIGRNQILRGCARFLDVMMRTKLARWLLKRPLFQSLLMSDIYLVAIKK